MFGMKLFFIFLLSLFVFPFQATAQVQVFPTYMTLSDEKISAHLNLRNSTTEPQTYKIEYAYFKMLKNGSFVKEKLPDDGVSEIIKFSPKKVRLLPGAKQVVRVMLTDLSTLSDGEKYLHLRFVPDTDEEDDAKKEKSKERTSFKLQAKIAVAVPIIVRKGKGNFAGTVSQIKADKDKSGDLNVSLMLKNTGPYYLHGDLEIFGVSGDSEVPLDKIVGLSSYIPERTFQKNYTSRELAELSQGKSFDKIKVIFKSNADSAAEFSLVNNVDIQAKSAATGGKKTSKRR